MVLGVIQFRVEYHVCGLEGTRSLRGGVGSGDLAMQLLIWYALFFFLKLIGCIIGRQAPKSMRSSQMSGRRSKLRTQWKDLLIGRLPSLDLLSIMAQYLINVR